MACEDCGVDPSKVANIVMVPMKPGHDGKPWEFCLRCFVEGTKPMKLGRVKVVPIGDEKLFNALVAQSKRLANCGSPVDDRRPDDPKASVGDFGHKPRGKRKAS